MFRHLYAFYTDLRPPFITSYKRSIWRGAVSWSIYRRCGWSIPHRVTGWLRLAHRASFHGSSPLWKCHCTKSWCRGELRQRSLMERQIALKFNHGTLDSTWNLTLVFQNPSNILWGSVWTPKRPCQEVFGGPNTSSIGVWMYRVRFNMEP